MIKRFQSAIEFILKAAGFSCRAIAARKATDVRLVFAAPCTERERVRLQQLAKVVTALAARDCEFEQNAAY